MQTITKQAVINSIIFKFLIQVSMWPWSCPVGGASLKTSPGRTAWQHWWLVMCVEPMRPPGWPAGLWCDTPTCLVSSSTALSAQPSTRGFPPCSTWCRQVRLADETLKLTVQLVSSYTTQTPQSCWPCSYGVLKPLRFYNSSLLRNQDGPRKY